MQPELPGGRLDPAYEKLLETVRGALDPAGILSPRAWRR